MKKIIQIRFATVLILFFICCLQSVSFAQDSSLKLFYSFKTTGTDVVDESGNAFNGVLKNGAVIQQIGKFNVVNLGSQNGYVDMTSNTGKLISSLSDFTVSLYVYVDSSVDLNLNGNFIWTFANSADMVKTANGNMFFIAKNTRYAISKTYWQNEISVSQGTALVKGNWQHVTYSQTDSTGRVYINGTLVKTGNVLLKPSVLGATTSNFIGRSCYASDVYLTKSYLSDFRVYNRALTSTEINTLASNRLALDSAINKMFVDTAKINLTVNELDSVTANLSLPSDAGDGVVITWQSSNTSVISNSGIVTRPSAGTEPVYLTLTATLTKNGISTTKDFAVRVMPYLSDSESVAIDISNLFLSENITLLRSNLVLPLSGNEGSSISWSSNNTDVLSNGGAIINRPPKGSGDVIVTLKATLTKGSAVSTKSFTVIVAEDEGFSAYLFAYFTGNSGDQEAIRFALSDDGYTYKALNNNKPVLSSAAISSTGGVRDPHILRGESSDYYMVATDMVSALGWNSNRAMILLKSYNMTDWQSSVVNIPDTYPQYAAADRVWAPQTIYDPTVGKYMVYFAMRLGSTDYDKIYYAYANDRFTGFENTPQLLFENSGKSVIDADIVFRGGKYHLFFKTEGNGNGIKKAISNNLTNGYVLYDKYLQSTTAAVEGGCVYRMYNTDKWMLIYDMYTSGAYQFTESMDLENFSITPNPASFDFTPRHGTIIPITSTEKQALLAKWNNTGLSQYGFLKNVTVSPNPANDFLTIEMDNEIKLGIELRIMDYSGRVILRKPVNSNIEKLDISFLNRGVYLIGFLSDKGLVGVTKFIVN
ncbi:MAG: immunoglobulin-like domain-containing protein [Paludibacteraceae bacterium]